MISLNVIFAGTKAHHLDEDVTSASMSRMHAVLKEKGYLADKDVKVKSLSFRVDLFEISTVHGNI